MHIIYRKIVAGLLLALLIFIYTEKTFHIHDRVNTNTEQAGVSIIFNNSICSICDFTIAKDAALPGPIVFVLPVSYILKEYIAFTPSYHFTFHDYLSTRGPPSL
ncbi:MAG: hypothetical protein ABIU11_06710 [Chitinophagaceae bacterium]